MRERAADLYCELCANTVGDTRLMHILEEVTECETYALRIGGENEKLTSENRALAEMVTRVAL